MGRAGRAELWHRLTAAGRKLIGSVALEEEEEMEEEESEQTRDRNQCSIWINTTVTRHPTFSAVSVITGSKIKGSFTERPKQEHIRRRSKLVELSRPSRTFVKNSWLRI